MEFSKLKDFIPNDILDRNTTRLNLGLLMSQDKVSFSQLIRAIKEIDRPNMIVFEAMNNVGKAKDMADSYCNYLRRILISIEQNFKPLYNDKDEYGLRLNIKILDRVIKEFHSISDTEFKLSIQEAITSKLLDSLDVNASAGDTTNGVNAVVALQHSLRSFYFRFTAGDIKQLWDEIIQVIEKYKTVVTPKPDTLEDKFQNPEVITECIKVLRKEDDCLGVSLSFIGGPKNKYPIIYWFLALQYHGLVDPKIKNEEAVRLLSNYFEDYIVDVKTFRTHSNEKDKKEKFALSQSFYRREIGRIGKS